MGLFGFVGKLLGGAVKVAANLATGNPLGAIKSGLGTVASILPHKGGPTSTTVAKINVLGRLPVSIARGNGTQSTPGIMTAVQRRASPVLPGGAIATTRGPVAATSATPPTRYGGSRTGKRKSSSRSSSRRASSRKRSGGGRRLKFGSPAWRKKYMKKGKRRRSKSR